MLSYRLHARTRCHYMTDTFTFKITNLTVGWAARLTRFHCVCEIIARDKFHMCARKFYLLWCNHICNRWVVAPPEPQSWDIEIIHKAVFQCIFPQLLLIEGVNLGGDQLLYSALQGVFAQGCKGILQVIFPTQLSDMVWPGATVFFTVLRQIFHNTVNFGVRVGPDGIEEG